LMMGCKNRILDEFLGRWEMTAQYYGKKRGNFYRLASVKKD
jgi:hypothetical protein